MYQCNATYKKKKKKHQYYALHTLPFSCIKVLYVIVELTIHIK